MTTARGTELAQRGVRKVHRRGRKRVSEQAEYEQLVQQMHRVHASGVAIREVARRFGYHPDSVTSAFQRRKLEIIRHPNKWTPEMDERLREAYSNGETAASLSEELGATAGAIRARASRLGVRWVSRGLTHGLPGTYGAGCRCYSCRIAHSEWRRKERERKRGSEPYKHGTATGYLICGCRCDECRAWMSQKNRARYERAKASA